MTIRRNSLEDRARRLARSVANSFRQLIPGERHSPDFIVIGTQKGGTTSLHSYLAQHHQVVRSYGKELHYFDAGLEAATNNYAKGPGWYLAHFPLKKNMPPQCVTGEATPEYLFNPDAPQRIKEFTPEIKLIALLRNPTDRAISQYFHEVRKGNEALPIEEAFDREDERLAEALSSCDYNCFNFVHYAYKARGRYAEQLKRYYNLFSKDQLLVLSSEDFFADVSGTIGVICDFLGVDGDLSSINFAPKNVGRDKAKVSESIYTELDEYFKPHNEVLFELLGKEFSW